MDREAQLRTMRVRARIGRERDGQEMTAPGVDPLVDRHGRELFGPETAPDETPAELRYVAPRRVLLEWVGQPSPFDSEIVLALKARGLLTAFHISILEQVALKCVARVDGRTSRTITKERDGLSETVRWGPRRGTYIQEVSTTDAERILSSPSGNEFRIVGKDAVETTHAADDGWKPVLGFLRRQSTARGLPPPPTNAEAAQITVRLGPEEQLVGLARTSNATGYWK